MEWVEITGHTVGEATELALDQLGVAAADAEVVVLAEPKVGLFGRTRGEARPVTFENLQFSPYLARCYSATAARGIKVLAAFTSLSPRHAYERQIVDAFPEISTAESLQLQHFPHSDHVFSAPKDRARLFRVIDSWLGAHWTV